MKVLLSMLLFLLSPFSAFSSQCSREYMVVSKTSYAEAPIFLVESLRDLKEIKSLSFSISKFLQKCDLKEIDSLKNFRKTQILLKCNKKIWTGNYKFKIIDSSKNEILVSSPDVQIKEKKDASLSNGLKLEVSYNLKPKNRISNENISVHFKTNILNSLIRVHIVDGAKKDYYHYGYTDNNGEFVMHSALCSFDFPFKKNELYTFSISSLLEENMKEKRSTESNSRIVFLKIK